VNGGDWTGFPADYPTVALVIGALLLAILAGGVWALFLSVRLAASTARLRSILDAADVGTWEWHIPSGRIRVDDRWADMVGYRREEIEQDITTWNALLHPDDVKRFDEAYQRHIDGHDDHYRVVVRLRHRDGHWVWIDDTGQVVERSPSGQPLLMRGTHKDITDEHRRNEQLAFVGRRDTILLLLAKIAEGKSEHDFAQAALQRLEELTDSSISFLHFVSEERQEVELIAWSRRTEDRYCDVVDFERHYPLSSAGIWADSVRSRSAQIVNDYAAASGRKGLPSGHASMQRFISVPLVDFGRTVMLIGVGNKASDYVARDVETVQLFANEIWRLIQRSRNQRSLQQASMVFEYAREGIIVTDGENRIVDVNPAFERISGYTREEVLGEDPRMFSSGRQSAEFYGRMWQQIRSEGVWEGEIWNRRKNGDVYPEHLNLSVIRDAAGNICNHIALFSDISLQKRQQDALQRLVHFDALTGLPNRVLLIDRLQQAMAQSRRHGHKLAVAFLDLDGFKAINDEHGHAVGDEMLVEVAARLKNALRADDTIARLGGDEFVAILTDFDDLAAMQPLFDRLLAAAAEPVVVGGVTVQASASIGVTVFPEVDGDGSQPEQLVRQADQAMYRAKNSGKNRLAFFSAADPESP
jgi:diguanylate cyclase (GGDEF)-like protein/PAS domain S-box-containing protein